MDEAGGFCGIVAVILVVVLIVVGWRTFAGRPDGRVADVVDAPAAPGDPPVPAADDAPRVDIGAQPDGKPGDIPGDAWPFGRRVTLGMLGALYAGGLFLLRSQAIRAKRQGATDQQAALIALTSFALSPIVVPVVFAWSGLGLLGRVLTSEPDAAGRNDRKPRGANDLD